MTLQKPEHRDMVKYFLLSFTEMKKDDGLILK